MKPTVYFFNSKGINYIYSSFTNTSQFVNFNNQILNHIILQITLLLAISDYYIFLRRMYDVYYVEFLRYDSS